MSTSRPASCTGFCFGCAPAASVVTSPPNTRPRSVSRKSTRYGFHKKPETWSDDRLAAGPKGDIWSNWSDEVRAVAV